MTPVRVHIGFLLVCLFNPVSGQLVITSSAFECGKTGTIVCSRTTDNVTTIRWYINGNPGQFCSLNFCQFPSFGNYQYSADNGVWKVTIGQVERKDSNITYSCQAYSTGGRFLSVVSRTVNVSVLIDNSSKMTTSELDTDTVFTAESNCITLIENVRITIQCVLASDENVIDSYCGPTSPSTYISACNDINETCAGPGTYRKRSVMKLATYQGNYFKFVKIKAVFTDGTNVVEKISGEVKHETPPRIALLRDCSVIENSDFSVNCSLSSGDPSTVTCTWAAPSGAISNDCTLWIPTVQRTSSGTYTCRVENSVGNDIQSFYLDIMYKTVISSLTIDDTYDRLVVNQNKADVKFKCNVSSNPLSQVSMHSETHSGSRILKEDPSSDHLLYSLSTATCWDSGEYTCSGRNNVTKNTVSKSVKLLVECTARPLHQAEPITTVYRGVGDDVTLKLTVVAYPIPASELFQWSRLEKEHSITYLNGSIVILSDSSLESKLSLTNIQDADFGQYKLAIRYNDILTAYVQYFSIQPQAIADSRSPNNGAIIGGAVGGGTVVIVVVIVVVVFLGRKAAAKSRRSADPQRRMANEHDLNDLTTGTQEPNGPNEYYNISSNPYKEVRTCSSSGPYEDLNRCSGTNHEYSTLNRISDDKTTTHLPTVKAYENLQVKPLR